MASEERGKSSALVSHWWSSPQLGRKNADTLARQLVGRRKSSEWTKIRHSLDFIRRSKEIVKHKKTNDDHQEDEKSKKSKSLTFLGQVYRDSLGEEEEVFQLECENDK